MCTKKCTISSLLSLLYMFAKKNSMVCYILKNKSNASEKKKKKSVMADTYITLFSVHARMFVVQQGLAGREV